MNAARAHIVLFFSFSCFSYIFGMDIMPLQNLLIHNNHAQKLLKNISNQLISNEFKHQLYPNNISDRLHYSDKLGSDIPNELRNEMYNFLVDQPLFCLKKIDRSENGYINDMSIYGEGDNSITVCAQNNGLGFYSEKIENMSVLLRNNQNAYKDNVFLRVKLYENLNELLCISGVMNGKIIVHRIQDLSTGRLLLEPIISTQDNVCDVRAFDFNKENLSLVVGTYDHCLKNFVYNNKAEKKDTKEWQLNSTVVFPCGILNLSISDNKKMIAIGCYDGNARILDADTQKILHIVNHNMNTVQFVNFSQDNSRLISSSYDKHIYISDIDNKKKIKTLSAKHPISTIYFDRQNSFIAIGSVKGEIIVWNIDNNYEKIFSKRFKVFKSRQSSVNVLDIVLNKDASLVAVATCNSKIYVHDIIKNRLIYSYQGRVNPSHIRFSQSGTTLVSAWTDGSLVFSGHYTQEQLALRNLLFLWLLVKKVPKIISTDFINFIMKDIVSYFSTKPKSGLELIGYNVSYDNLWASWDSLFEVDQNNIYTKCIESLNGIYST